MSSETGNEAWRDKVRLQTKYSNPNPIAKMLTGGFLTTMEALARPILAASPQASVLECGCGEGINLARLEAMPEAANATLRGFDIDDPSLENARVLVKRSTIEKGSIYAIQAEDASADLVLCLEVLEHLEEPEKALTEIKRVARGPVLLSVPREPLWCALNMARGKYWGSLGNTPGHLNHWSRGRFVALVSRYFEVVEVRSPIPWTMLRARVRR